MAMLKKCGRRKLCGRVHREIGVGNDLETVERLLSNLFWPANSDPRKLHLRQPGNLGHTRQRKGQCFRVRSERGAAGAIVREVEEDLVDNESKVSVLCQRVQVGNLTRTKVGT